MPNFGVQGSALNSSVIPFKLKQFVSASSSSSSFDAENSSETCASAFSESGEFVRSYYLNTVICENEETTRMASDSEEISICKEVIHKNKSENSPSRGVDRSLVNKAMKYAQHDDLQNLQRMVDCGVSINAIDYFGWSLLMVAACAGSDRVVKYLVAKNARGGRRDSKGNTALFLACKNNNKKVVDLLTKNKEEKVSIVGNQHPSMTLTDVEVDQCSNSSYFCEKCNVTSNCSRKQHNTSIVHLLREGSREAKPIYGISRSNIGFQMLLQQGWNDREGLGPDGAGRRYPIKTKQKKGRSGIGEETKDGKNSSCFSDGAVRKEKMRLLSLKSTRRLVRKEKLREKELRRVLNEPDL